MGLNFGTRLIGLSAGSVEPTGGDNAADDDYALYQRVWAELIFFQHIRLIFWPPLFRTTSGLDGNLRAKVSSILTISLALVSMNPQSLPRAHPNPWRLETCLASFRSHLLPATILTGCTPPESCRCSHSMSTICRK